MTEHGSKIPVVFLHGFTGKSDDWFTVINEIDDACDPVTINLVGHGTKEPPDDMSEYTIDAQVARIASIADRVALEKFVLAGYSMGGRIALSFAAEYPDRLDGLILESSTPGIEDARDRRERIESDEELAQYLESNSLETFIDRWINLPLFASQSRLPREVKERSRAQKLDNSKTALMNTLRAAGTGRMQPLWDTLPQFHMPVLLITGGIDEKFTGINQRMAQLLPICKHEIIGDAGHNVHLEEPEEYGAVVREYLNRMIA